MTLDQFLKWFLSHNVVLIEAMIVLILVGVSFVLYRSVLSGKEEASGGTSLVEIEKTLRKVLDATQTKPAVEVEKAASLIQDSESPGAVPPSNAGTAPDPQAAAAAAAQAADLEKLRTAMAEREKTLADLQKALEDAKKAAPTTPPIDTKPLEDKIKELQAKLAEYEIIEDDIANLSTYKTENQKLKSEMDALRAKLGGSTAAETGAASENVKKFAALVGAEVPPSTPPPRPGEAIKAAATTANANPVVAPVAVPAPAEPPAVGAVTSPPAAAAEAAPAPVTVKDEPATQAAASTPAPTDAAESVFGEVDTEKLLAETANLPEAAPTSEASGDEDNGAKLISEFENFMKGG